MIIIRVSAPLQVTTGARWKPIRDDQGGMLFSGAGMLSVEGGPEESEAVWKPIERPRI